MTLIGRSENTDITITHDERRRGMYILGNNGTGKTVLIENTIVQDITAGHGVCVLDAHGDLLRYVINHIPEKRLGDAILIDPLDTDYPFNLNVFYCPNPKDPKLLQLTIEQIEAVFRKVWGASNETPRLNQYVRNIARVFVPTFNTIIEIPAFLRNISPFRQKILAGLPAKTKEFWLEYDELSNSEKDKRRESTLDRIDSVVGDEILYPILGQKNTLNFREILDQGKILLVQLNSYYEQMTTILGSIIIGQILLAALSRSEVSPKKRKFFALYADEFQRFSTPAMSQLLTEARKFGIATTVAHQFRDQLDETNKGGTLQAGNFVFFQIGPKDAEDLAGLFSTTPGEIEKTFPRDIFRYMPHHKSNDVKWFYHNYVKRWQDAIGQSEREQTQTYNHMTPIGIMDTWDEVEIIQPKAILNPLFKKEIWYNPLKLREVFYELEDYLFQTMQRTPQTYEIKGGEEFEWTITRLDIKERRLKHLLQGIAKFLDFPYYIRHVYELMDRFETEQYDEYVKSVNLDSEFFFRQKSTCDYFLDALTDTILALYEDPIEIEVAGNTEQTHSDKKAEIANDMVHLKTGEAMVKTPDGEWKIETVFGERRYVLPNYPRNLKIIIENTRKNYCRPRAEVDQEIAKRLISEPTQRRGEL